MSLYICAISDPTGFFPGVSKTVTLTILDSDPNFVSSGGAGNWLYSVTFSLFSVSSGGFSLGTIGSYSTTIASGTEPTSFQGNVSVNITIPSGTSTGTYYIGATPPKVSSLRLAISVNTAVTTLIFNLNGGDGTTPPNMTQTQGSSFMLPGSSGFYRSGFTPFRWWPTADGSGIISYDFATAYVFNQNTTLFVIWSRNSYSITFNTNGGTSVSTITQLYESVVTQPSNPSKTGNTFAGWYSDSGLTTPYIFSTMPAENIILYAKWTINDYTITFVSNGGTAVDSLTAPYQSNIVAPTQPTRVGYTFNGWYSDIGLSVLYTFSTMPLNGITLFAKWIINKYNIVYKNGSVTLYTCSLDYNSVIPAPTTIPTRTTPKIRYKFNGWSLIEDASVPSALGNVPVDGTIVYAAYITHASSLKINGFDVNLKYGNTQIKKVYKGDTLLWEDYHV